MFAETLTLNLAANFSGSRLYTTDICFLELIGPKESRVGAIPSSTQIPVTRLVYPYSSCLKILTCEFLLGKTHVC